MIVFVYALESERLQQDLLKVEQLESKVSAELQTLRDQLELMKHELHTYRDLEALTAAGEDRKKVRLLGAEELLICCALKALVLSCETASLVRDSVGSSTLSSPA